MLTPAPERRILRKMNFISDQKGIIRRYLRERDGWNGHLMKAGAFITGILKEGTYSHIVVLGSGWLLDFPLENVLPYIEKITLVDVHFPPPVLKRIKNLEKVECVRADITGGYIQAIYDQLRSNRQSFSIPHGLQNPVIIPEEGKLIISLNILNQLDILLVDYILKYVDCDKVLISEFRKALQDAHIRMLQHHPFVLITDYKEILINNQGKTLEERELVFSQFPQADLMQEWEWQFDTYGLYNHDADTQMKVKALFSKGPQKH